MPGEKKRKLHKERSGQLRLGRVAAALQQDDERINAIFDIVIDEIGSGRVDKLSIKLHKGEDQQ